MLALHVPEPKGDHGQTGHANAQGGQFQRGKTGRIRFIKMNEEPQSRDKMPKIKKANGPAATSEWLGCGVFGTLMWPQKSLQTRLPW